jgi:hypothetical protein
LPIEAGEYHVSFDNVNHCPGQSPSYHVKKESHILSADLNCTDRIPLLYPNPGQGLYQLQWPECWQGEVKLRISDALGRVVYRETVEVGQSERKAFSLLHLSAGLYYVEVNYKKENLYFKLIHGKGL